MDLNRNDQTNTHEIRGLSAREGELTCVLATVCFPSLRRQYNFRLKNKSLELNELGPGRTSHNLRKKVSVIMLT